MSENRYENIFLNTFIRHLRWLKWGLARGINFGYMMAAALQIFTLSSPTSLMKTGTDSIGSCSQVVTEHLWLWTQLCWDPAMASSSRFALVRTCKKCSYHYQGPLLLTWINFLQAWITNHTLYKVWDNIKYSPTSNSATVILEMIISSRIL